MSKADTLGPSRSLAAVRSARRNAISSIGGEDATAAVTELPVTVISDNPDNPRNHLRNLDETVETVREHGVILPIVVGTVDAYLHNRPDRADDLDDGAQYVVIDGHRRLEASRRVGLATIPVRVDNARLATDESLLEVAFIANYHRDDMTDLEEAHALKQLVEHYGSQTKAAKRLGIPQATISSKLSLLKLTPELQKDLMTGERSVEHVRNLGRLSPEEQLQKADERARAAKARTAAQREAAEAAPGAGPADYHGVIIPGGSQPSPGAPEPAAPAVQEPRPAPVTRQPDPAPGPAGQESVPGPRGDAVPAAPVVEKQATAKMPWHDGDACAEIADVKMTRAERNRMMHRLIEKEKADQERDAAAARTN